MLELLKKFAVPMFTVLAAAGIAAAIYMIFFVAPLQYGLNDDGKVNGSSLFFNQKIFFLHTAHAILLIIAVIVSAVSALVFLLTRKPVWDDIASASVDV